MKDSEIDFVLVFHHVVVVVVVLMMIAVVVVLVVAVEFVSSWVENVVVAWKTIQIVMVEYAPFEQPWHCLIDLTYFDLSLGCFHVQ